MYYFSECADNLENVQKQPPKVFYKQGFLKNFGKFTGKPEACKKRDSACNFITKETPSHVFL